MKGIKRQKEEENTIRINNMIHHFCYSRQNKKEQTEQTQRLWNTVTI